MIPPGDHRGGKWRDTGDWGRRAKGKRDGFSLVPVQGDAGRLPLVLNTNKEVVIYNRISEDRTLGAGGQVATVSLVSSGRKTSLFGEKFTPGF